MTVPPSGPSNLKGSTQLTYARKASGLVRGLSLVDCFGVGLMTQGVTPSLWVFISLGLGVYMGGNLLLATLISVVLAGIGIPIVWGMLAGSMPRAGGEYIYNSRILHPLLGMAESFTTVIVFLLWIALLAPWVADPGLTTMASLLGWQGVADFVSTSSGVYVVATVTNIVALLFVVFGVKWYAIFQKIFMSIGLIGLVVMGIVLLSVSKDTYIDNWNALAAQYDSLPWDAVVPAVATAAGEAIPTTWNWLDTFGLLMAASWLFGASYMTVYVAGEVKRPDRTLILANLFAILVPAFFTVWIVGGMQRLMDHQFMAATAWMDANGAVPGYNLPFSTNFMGLIHVANGSGIVAFIMGLSFIAFGLWWTALEYLGFPRALFAWGMDRMGPKWFTDVNPRFSSPVKTHLLCFVLGQTLITVYVFWTNNPLAALSATLQQVFGLFGLTAISALVFAYRKRSRFIWESSPYHEARLFGIPVIVLGAVVYLIYLALLAIAFFGMPDTGALSWGSAIFIGGSWILGIAWYFFWKARARAEGVDIGQLAYNQLPPD